MYIVWKTACSTTEGSGAWSINHTKKIKTIPTSLRLTIFSFGTNVDFVIGTYEGYDFVLSLTKTSVTASPKPSVIMADTA